MTLMEGGPVDMRPSLERDVRESACRSCDHAVCAAVRAAATYRTKHEAWVRGETWGEEAIAEVRAAYKTMSEALRRAGVLK